MGALVWLASYPKSGNTWVRSFLLNLLRDKDEPADINALDRVSPSDSLRSWYEPVAGKPLDIVLSLADHFGMKDLDRAIALMAEEGAGTRLTENYVPEFYRSWSSHVSSWTARPG